MMHRRRQITAEWLASMRVEAGLSPKGADGGLALQEQVDW